MKNQHSPGPWGWKISQPSGSLQIRNAFEPIAHAYGPDRSEHKPYFTERGAKTVFGADCERSEANASLISAAPELLAALKEAEKELGARLEIIGFPAGSVDEPRARARAAILKAEGGE